MGIFKHLYVQVLIAIAIGIALGIFYPALAVDMKPLGDGFIKLIKMVIGPIIFCTIVSGIAGMRDMKSVGRVGIKALVYFEVMTSLALVIGLVIVNLVKPGVGINADVATISTDSIAKYTAAARSENVTDFLLHIIPDTFTSAFTEGDLLQILLIAVLAGSSLTAIGGAGERVLNLIDDVGHLFFRVVALIMRVAPIGAFGAMAFTIGKYGAGSLAQLGLLMVCFYATCLLFIFVVLGLIMRVCGLSIFKYLNYIKAELLLVLGTSSSESALPRLMDKLEHLGCSRPVVGLVVPTGYSFNLDGTSIYLTMAAIFIAQATNTPLTIWQEVSILAVLLLTSKGAAGVTGSGFITLAATLTAVSHVPIEGIALILGIDRFMSEARALTNIIGNGVATIVVAKWEGQFDHDRAELVLAGRDPALLATDTERLVGA
ncbi:MAG: dicarboxylate/amino acid:cation symporter [Parvibaculaceae bacterium]|nr:dicarboxylate/amino acid:cation symporter [Parvibaculaceae bacterium]